MEACDFISHTGRLRRATSKLKEQWQETLESWNDGTSRQFQDNYLEPLLPEISLTLAAVQNMSAQLQRAAAECADPDRETF
jgi:uncharacterized protein YukE